MKKLLCVLSIFTLIACNGFKSVRPTEPSPFRVWYCEFTGMSFGSGLKLRIPLDTFNYGVSGTFIEHICDAQDHCDPTPVATVKVLILPGNISILEIDGNPPSISDVAYKVGWDDLQLINPTGDVVNMGDLLCKPRF